MSWSSASILLSPAARKRCVARLRGQPTFRPDLDKPALKTAAVLIPVCVSDNSVSVLYTVRSQMLKSHSGQISFPGGMTDAGESSQQTALRETEEEIGLPKERIEVLGVGGAVPGRNMEVYITPVVGIINDFSLSELKPCEDEVQEVFTVPIQELCNPVNHGHTKFKKYELILPVFMHDKYTIWGITGLLTHIFLQSVVPKDHYIHDLTRNRIDPDNLINFSKL